MNCPACGGDCVKAAEEVLEKLDRLYMACPACPPDPALNKDAPLRSLPRDVERCRACGRAPLDAVMLDALRILERFGLRSRNDTLRSVGSPLVTFGCPLAYPPRLGKGDLIIAGERLGKEAAREMVRLVPEIKGVILSRGVAGVRDLRAPPGQNELLAGCDLRADLAASLFGELLIYKSQSKIHIEFSRVSAPKMRILEQLWSQGNIRDVVDGLCGPGTLGLMCALAGASRVVLNDAWLPAVQNVMLNLQVNQRLLGLDEIELVQMPTSAVGREPVLVGRASGACEIEVYHGDLARLFSRALPARLCLIDHFPGAEIGGLEEACRCCAEVVIV